METTLYNDWYVRTDNRIGPYTITTSQQPSSYQIHNATKIYNYLRGLGWSISAVCGIIGNMMHESTIDPAFIQETHRSDLPNSAASLSDVPNSVMLGFDSTRQRGIGLVQWDGHTDTAPAGQKLVSFAIRYTMVWYDGDTQVFRIRREKETNIQWQSRTLFGTTWTWTNFITNTRTPEDSAHIFRACYEVAAAGVPESKANARWWYDYFTSGPTPPTPPIPEGWITGEEFSRLALAYDPDVTGHNIPYSELDCIGFVQKVWRDIPAVSSSETMCNPVGTNTLWRTNTPEYPSLVKTFNTTSPAGQNPTPICWVKDTLTNIRNQNDGEIPAGTCLMHKIGEDDPPAIPDRYRGDGFGNFAHIGIYCGNNTVMQSGGRDSSSVPGGGVHRSVFDSSAWNYGVYICYVDPTGEIGPSVFPNWLLLWYANKRKEVLKNVRRKF